MSSKREQLKNLRSAQKQVHSDETPAENYSNNAAKVMTESEPQAPANTVSSEKKVEAINATETAASPALQPAPMPIAQAESASIQSVHSVTNEPGKRISVSLRTENKNWMHRTAIRCGLSIQDYMNILIEEAWQREKAQPYVWNENDPLPERIPSSKTVLVAIKLTDENIEHSKRMRAAHGMTMTYYMNYLIEEEAKREQQEGMRHPVFDEI